MSIIIKNGSNPRVNGVEVRPASISRCRVHGFRQTVFCKKTKKREFRNREERARTALVNHLAA